ncbi:MAG: tetratricopeptide repeat protein [Candidatus Riflebacteria bacterium]
MTGTTIEITRPCPQRKKSSRKPAIKKALLRDLWFNFGFLTALDREEDSIDDLKRIIEINPCEAAAFFHLGCIYFRKADLARAEYYLACAAELEPDAPNVAFFYGTCLSMSGNQQKSVPWLEAACAASPRDHAPRFNLGISCMILERTEEAMQHFARTLELRPNFLPAAYNLGLYFLKNEQPQRARHYFTTCLKIDPGFSLAWRNLTRISLGENDVQAARSKIMQGISLLPEDPGLRIDLIALDNFERNDNGLLKILEKSLEKYPGLIPETLEKIVEFRNMVKKPVPFNLSDQIQ